MLNEHLDILCCPDDGAPVFFRETDLECSRCGRGFRAFAPNFIEMLPSVFPAWGLSGKDVLRKNVEMAYYTIYKQKFRWHDRPAGWGDLSTASPGYRAFIKAEVEWIRKRLGPIDGKYLADVSGGVGNYSIPLSMRAAAMIHCELDADSIQTAFRRSDGGNGIFIRTPYNKLPFHADVFDTVICTDTLIRGWDHERVLLGEINRILKPGGKAVVDFHNNRLQINGDICLYSRRKIQALLASANIMNYDIYPFGYVPSLLVPKESLYPYLDRACGLLLPCQRHIVVFTKSGGAPR